MARRINTRVLTLPELDLLSKDLEEGLRAQFLRGVYKPNMPVNIGLNVVRSLIITARERWEAIAMQDGLAQAWVAYLEDDSEENFDLLNRLLAGQTKKRREGKTDSDNEGSAVHVDPAGNG